MLTYVHYDQFGNIMRIAFFVSSVGDTDLALKTIEAMQASKQDHEVDIISLTSAAAQRVNCFNSSLLKSKVGLSDIIGSVPEGTLSTEQLSLVRHYVNGQIDYAYYGVPSVNNEIPFQLAESLDIPSLIAYEFMFKPEQHCLWNHLAALSQRPQVKWALPLPAAKEDFSLIPDDRRVITGHISIDNAYTGSQTSPERLQEVRRDLQVSTDDSLAFISSTTQPLEVDANFIDCLLEELKQHPNMQVRLGLHPGIQNLDEYLQKILAVYQNHSAISAQFKIILPDNLVSRIKEPQLTIDNPLYKSIFLRVNMTGSEAASAADRVSQAVPGALLNQAALEGKPAYSHSGKSYLPEGCFSNSLNTFFQTPRQAARPKSDLGLGDRTAPEAIADIINLSQVCR